MCVFNYKGQGVNYDQPQESPLAAQTIHLVMEFYRLYRHAHRQVGSRDFGPGVYVSWCAPDHHRGGCDCGDSPIHHRCTFSCQGVVVIRLKGWHQKTRGCLKSHNIVENILKRSGVGVGFEQNAPEKIPYAYLVRIRSERRGN